MVAAPVRTAEPVESAAVDRGSLSAVRMAAAVLGRCADCWTELPAAGTAGIEAGRMVGKELRLVVDTAEWEELVVDIDFGEVPVVDIDLEAELSVDIAGEAGLVAVGIEREEPAAAGTAEVQVLAVDTD